MIWRTGGPLSFTTRRARQRLENRPLRANNSDGLLMTERSHLPGNYPPNTCIYLDKSLQLAKLII
jgi:hypothetical protein